MKITPTGGGVRAQTATTTSVTPSRQRAIEAWNKVSEARITPAENTAATSAPAAEISQTTAALMGAAPAPVATSTPSADPVTAPAEAQADAPQVETKPAEDKSLSAQYNVLARRERALRAKAQQQDQALKAREAALAAKEAELQAKAKEYETGYVPKARLKSETLSVLAEEGLSYDELTQQILNQPQTDPRVSAHIQRLEQQIRRLEQANEESAKAQTSAQEQQYQAAVKQIKADVTRLVSSDPTFETVKATNSISDVVELIEKTYREDGVLLSVEEAAQEVEDYLVDEALKLAKLNKVRTRLNPPVATESKANTQQPVQPKQPQPIKTLTNATGSTRQMTARERAVLAFKGELKS